MTYGDYSAGIPARAVEDLYVNPPDMGGLRANYPIVNSTQQYGLFNEVQTDWLGDKAQVWESQRGMDYSGDVPSYNGAVWSIQLTARPGYHVSSEQLEQMVYSDEEDYPPYG